jgi:hypothetical protein
MKITVCDICQKQPALYCSFVVDREMDAAGSMDDVAESMDLCLEHMRDFLYNLAKRSGKDLVKYSYEEMKKRVDSQV